PAANAAHRAPCRGAHRRSLWSVVLEASAPAEVDMATADPNERIKSSCLIQVDGTQMIESTSPWARAMARRRSRVTRRSPRPGRRGGGSLSPAPNPRNGSSATPCVAIDQHDAGRYGVGVLA